MESTKGRYIPCWCGLAPASHNGNLARLAPEAYAGHEYAPIPEWVRRAQERRLPPKVYR